MTCPTLVLWSSRDDLENLYGDPLAIWHDWADNISGHSIDSDHHMAEDNPSQLVDAIRRFRHPTRGVARPTSALTGSACPKGAEWGRM